MKDVDLYCTSPSRFKEKRVERGEKITVPEDQAGALISSNRFSTEAPPKAAKPKGEGDK